MSGLDDASIITTRRLVLRPLCVDDAGEMASVLADPALHEFTGGEPAALDELRDRYVTWVRGSGSASEIWLNWIVRRIADSLAIGTVQATIVNPDTAPVALVAWTIGTAWQRQGFATEATRGLVQDLAGRGVVSVVAHVHPDHRASARVAANAGLQETGDVVDGEIVWRMDLAADQSV